jgi:hypothetical protein
VHAIEAIAADGWDPAAISTDQLKDYNIGPILEEAEVDCSPMYKGYWNHWKSCSKR